MALSVPSRSVLVLLTRYGAVPPYRSPNFILKKTSYRYCNKLKKKKTAQQSKLRASVTHSSHGITASLCTHIELYRFGLYTCKYSVQYYLGTSTAALARALAATIGSKSPGAHSRCKSDISASVNIFPYSSQIFSICTNYSVLEKF